MRGGRRKNRPGLPAEAVSKKGRTTPLYLEGLKLTRLGFSSIYLFDRRKLLHIWQRGKGPQNAKKRGLRPEKSGGSPASSRTKPCFCHLMEKASMENHFGFWALKSPQTRMNTKKKGLTSFLSTLHGAGGGTRTHTPLRITDFESVSSANSDTPAFNILSRLPMSCPRNRRDIVEGH